MTLVGYCLSMRNILFSASHRLLLSLSHCLLVFVVLCCSIQARASTPDWVQLNWENDIFANADAGYTNGIGVTWGYKSLTDFSQDALPAWISDGINHTYMSGFIDRKKAVTYAVGQMMFTPAEITATQLLVDDRPYAGLLFWSASLYAFNDEVADQLSLTLGVVGPASLAEQSQRLVHSLISSDDPKGWSHQLKDEPVFALTSERLWRVDNRYDEGIEYDVIAGGGLRAGNLQSAGYAGVAVRMGSQLSTTWASLSMIPSRTINIFASGKLPSWQLYLSVGGSYVINDITINGNTFQDSHSVSLIHEQVLVSSGLAINSGVWGVSLSYQRGSDQFTQQAISTRYGSLAFIYRYQ